MFQILCQTKLGLEKYCFGVENKKNVYIYLSIYLSLFLPISPLLHISLSLTLSLFYYIYLSIYLSIYVQCVRICLVRKSEEMKAGFKN